MLLGIAQHVEVHILLEDDGAGVTDEELETIRNTPHYMMGSGSGVQLRHGLGLLIVRQIAAAHGGQVRIGHSRTGGFLVEILLPTLAEGLVAEIHS